jgi:hypothetical protein
MWIPVVVVICAQAKDLGRQYTKRLLPDFLIPFARMRLDAVVEAGRRKESGSTLEECCRILGCIDLRTARKHLERLEETAGKVALRLAEGQTAAVHLHSHSYRLQPVDPLERLEELLGREKEAQLRGGGAGRWSVALRPLLQAALWKSIRKVPTSYASRPPPDS